MMAIHCHHDGHGLPSWMATRRNARRDEKRTGVPACLCACVVGGVWCGRRDGTWWSGGWCGGVVRAGVWSGGGGVGRGKVGRSGVGWRGDQVESGWLFAGRPSRPDEAKAPGVRSQRGVVLRIVSASFLARFVHLLPAIIIHKPPIGFHIWRSPRAGSHGHDEPAVHGLSHHQLSPSSSCAAGMSQRCPSVPRHHDPHKTLPHSASLQVAE